MINLILKIKIINLYYHKDILVEEKNRNIKKQNEIKEKIKNKKKSNNFYNY